MYIKQLDINTLDNDKFFNPPVSVYNSLQWLKIYDKNLLVMGIFDDNNRIFGTFNIYLQKKYFIKYYRTPFFSPTIALYFENAASNPAKIMSENKKIMEMLAQYIDKLPYNILSISLPLQYVDMQNFIWKKFKVSPSYTYTIDLKQDIKTIENNFAPERRNDIKKALKDQIECQLCTDYKIVKDIILKTFSRKHKQIDIDYINKILFEFASPQNSFAFVSFKDKTAIAAAFCIFDTNKTYYILGGYDNTNKHKGAGAIAIFEAIKYAKNLNIPVFDFEGSMLQEVERYFRGFGGEIKPYYSINKANFILEILLKFFKRHIF